MYTSIVILVHDCGHHPWRVHSSRLHVRAAYDATKTPIGGVCIAIEIEICRKRYTAVPAQTQETYTLN